jgi:hypothetical protein
MSVTAHFDADTSAFRAEVQKAEQQVTQFEAATTTTGTAIVGMGTTTTKTATQVNTMTESFRQVDGVLNAVGIHLGPAVKGLEDVRAAAGKSATELGLFGTAGLVAGAAMAGWKIGEGIHDLVQKFWDLDGAIANATTKLMGWADVGAAQAAAQSDTLAAATKHLREMTGDATATVTDFSKAVQINTEWLAWHKKGAKDNADALKEWEKASAAVAVAAQNHAAVLQTINGSTVEAAKFALAHGVALDTVRIAYGLTAAQIAAVEAALKSEQEAAKASEKEHARITAELKEHWDAVLKIRDEALGKDAIEKATQWTEAIQLLGGSVKSLSHEQLVDLQKAMTEAMTAMARTGNLTAEGAAQFTAFATAAANAETALRPVVTATNDLVTAQAALVAEADAATAALKKQGEEAEAAARAVSSGWGMHPGGQAPASSGLTQVSRIGGDQFLVNPQTGEVIQKLQRQFGDGFLGWGPQGPPPTVNLTVDGNILGTQDGLAKLIGDALTYSYRTGGSRLPA